jgi:hypothetical protein
MAMVTSLFFLLVYFAPSIVAACREHNKLERLILLNLCFGWTGIGWFALVGWAWIGKGKVELDR